MSRPCRCWALVRMADGVFRVDDHPPPLDMLMVRGREDVTLVRDTGAAMHRALCGLYQCSDDLQDGDSFQHQGRVLYRCIGVHVVAVPTPTA